MHPLVEVPSTLTGRGAALTTCRLGLVVTRGLEVEPLAPGVWAVPGWRLFGPAVWVETRFNPISST